MASSSGAPLWVVSRDISTGLSGPICGCSAENCNPPVYVSKVGLAFVGTNRLPGGLGSDPWEVLGPAEVKMGLDPCAKGGWDVGGIGDTVDSLGDGFTLGLSMGPGSA